MGEKLADMGYSGGIAPVTDYYAVKVPVFSFIKLVGLDTHLGPEMKSTGEVLGLGKTFEEALYKGLVAAGHKMSRSSVDGVQRGILVTVRNGDKKDVVPVVEKLVKYGFALYSTKGTAKFLKEKGFEVNVVQKIRECPGDNTETLLESGKVAYVISTSERGRDPAFDDVKIRMRACTLGIPCLTSVDTANALADSLLSGFTQENTTLVDINTL
jgi:carbamoyl-phosphate synthase large subunit